MHSIKSKIPASAEGTLWSWETPEDRTSHLFQTTSPTMQMAKVHDKSENKFGVYLLFFSFDRRQC